ncbi:MAG: protein kinase, partial [Paludibacteraceae bacterium]|nr:protein kinase [Paludibacteraceae bacterium]
MDISDSGFISPAAFSAEWQDITLLQQRNHNCLYTASRYGKRYVLKGLSADCQSLTDMLLLQQKEFSLGITLSHPNIAETYSLEEVADCGRCIVMEYVDGITLAEWLATNPSHSARQRVMLQLLDALEYIHSLQLVHHDLKSSNILITRNGQNVKLIDFGLSELDTTNPQNDIQHDIQKFGQMLQLLFPARYKRLRQQCQNGQLANMAAIRLSIEKRQRRQKYIPYIIAIIILIISALLSVHTYRIYQESEHMAQVANEYAQKQQREQE